MTAEILTNLIAFLGPVIGIFLVIFCIVQGAKLLKGGEGGSIKALITGVFMFLFILGIMYTTKSYEVYGQIFADTSSNVMQGVGEELKGMTDTTK